MWKSRTEHLIKINPKTHSFSIPCIKFLSSLRSQPLHGTQRKISIGISEFLISITYWNREKKIWEFSITQDKNKFMLRLEFHRMTDRILGNLLLECVMRVNMRENFYINSTFCAVCIWKSYFTFIIQVWHFKSWSKSCDDLSLICSLKIKFKYSKL